MVKPIHAGRLIETTGVRLWRDWKQDKSSVGGEVKNRNGRK